MKKLFSKRPRRPDSPVPRRSRECGNLVLNSPQRTLCYGWIRNGEMDFNSKLTRSWPQASGRVFNDSITVPINRFAPSSSQSHCTSQGSTQSEPIWFNRRTRHHRQEIDNLSIDEEVQSAEPHQSDMIILPTNESRFEDMINGELATKSGKSIFKKARANKMTIGPISTIIDDSPSPKRRLSIS